LHTLSAVADPAKIFKAGSILTTRDYSVGSGGRQHSKDSNGCVKTCCKHYCSRSRSKSSVESGLALNKILEVKLKANEKQKRKLNKNSKLAHTAAFIRRMMEDVQMREERNNKFEEYRDACCYHH